MFSKTPNRAAQGILLVVLSIVFWKSQHPVIVVTTFLVLSGVVFNVFIHIHNGELDRKATIDAVKNNGKHILAALVLQLLTITVMGLLTWVLLYKKADIIKTLL